MKDLYFVVEGETEKEFVDRLLIPYLYQRGISTHIQSVIISMKGGGHGFNNITHFGNTIEPLLHYQNEPIITTMIDHSGINSEQKLPNYLRCIKHNNTEQRISCMEESLKNYVNSIKPYPNFIPNILRHEFETLLFANPSEGFDLEDEEIKNKIIDLKSGYTSIEDINTNPDNFPSKRLERIFAASGKKYNKIVDGIDIAELTGLETIIEYCPRFSVWLENIISLVLAS
ncbi:MULTISPECIES: DUF4276 family protein [Flectobacillus]|uniref:DUF4276 family protein n=1 Tax=Flectobacillus roseus TaxID=502259 RepID=A0ABT6Y650_9BACT|nr:MULTISPECIES: DUF4276 family protein [Flectobacillus]MDI9859039.1 DUF4276 family protein [Flectobacillus roseus]NBA77385.1 DUF4276 family protein [Emticicia sp. ODNR4P]PAC33238.1 hypothetical protein BWI92_01645 [Flectobacillus sp. BAB-3569]